MNQLRNVIARFVNDLEAAGISEALLSVQWIVQNALGYSRAQIISRGDDLVSPKDLEKLRHDVLRRKRGEPVQYIVGHTEFMGYRFSVGPGVLIPRPETESLVVAALERIADDADWRVLDIGTGSGCIAVCIKKFRPNCYVSAIDISGDAIGYAERNADRLDADVQFIRGDATSGLVIEQLGRGSVDIVVSNPPYVSLGERDSLQSEVRDFEPHVALFAEGDGLQVYADLLPVMSALVRPGGLALVEVHSDRFRQVQSLFMTNEFGKVEVYEDLQGRPRIVCGVREASSASS